MKDVWKPGTAMEVVEAVNDALSHGRTLEIVGTASRRLLGRPVSADAVLELSALSGVVIYEPEELILVVAPGTPMLEIQSLLAEHNQHLPFEPADYNRLWGMIPGAGTIGGAIMTASNGSRRLTAGGARDYMLGLKGVNGFGEQFVAGGRVVKNVTGFDLPKLLTGSFGTLCAATELTLKVLPKPPDAATLVIFELNDESAMSVMRHALNEVSAQVSSAAHLPLDVVSSSSCVQIASRGMSATLLRIEGFGPSVVSGLAELHRSLGLLSPSCILNRSETTCIWDEISGATLFAGSENPVWRLSVPPVQGANLASQIKNSLGGRCFYDWAGGEIWYESALCGETNAREIREILQKNLGADGHATLIRADAGSRAVDEPFQRPLPVLAALNERVRLQFDPHTIFNPGRMYGSNHAN